MAQLYFPDLNSFSNVQFIQLALVRPIRFSMLSRKLNVRYPIISDGHENGQRVLVRPLRVLQFVISPLTKPSVSLSKAVSLLTRERVTEAWRTLQLHLSVDWTVHVSDVACPKLDSFLLVREVCRP